MSAGAMVVVGAGLSGAQAALTLREAGWTGEVVLVGEEPGAPYDRPPLSKAALLDDTHPGAVPLLPESALRDAGVRHLAGVAAVAVDRQARTVVLADGTALTYAGLLLATGSRARALVVPGAGHVLSVRTATDALALRRRLVPGSRLVVVGGGVLGLEVAAAAVQRGCRVAVVEAGPRVLGRGVPTRVAAVLAQVHTARGVELRCSTGVRAVHPSADGLRVELTDGTAVQADTVAACVGGVPETALAQRAGLDVADGVLVDGRLATSDPSVFAAGDCCAFPHPLYDGRRLRLEAWRSAREQGRSAALSMLGGTAVFDRVPSSWSDQYDHSLHVAGLPGAGTTEVVRSRPDGVDVCFSLAPDGRLLSAAAVGPGHSAARDVKTAERLVERRATPDPAALADPSVPLRGLLP